MQSNPNSIAIIEDDPAQEAAISSLMSSVANCHVFSSGQTFLTALGSIPNLQLIVIDWGLPDLSGMDVLKALRTNNITTPVLFLTSRSSESDVVAALTAGADDYLVKPFRAGELLARANNLMRRYTQVARLESPPLRNAAYILGLGIKFDRAACTVHMPHQAMVELTQREFDLMMFLFDHINQPVSRDTIMEYVWQHADNSNSRTLDTHISKIRTKLGLRPELGWRLTPVYSFGYRLDYQLPK